MARKKAEKEIVELSEEEQPYELSEGWKWEMLENVCDSIKAGGDKPKAISKDKTVDMPIPVVANGIENEGIVGYTNIIGNEGNSVTVSGRGTIGKSFYRKEAYFPIVRVIVLNPSSNIKPQYLKYIFDCFEEKSTGSSIPQLTVPKIKVKIIPLPPKETQQKIVDIIESLFAKLDIAQEKVEQVLAESENRRAIILHNAFSGRLTEKWREENEVSFDSWKKDSIKSLCNSLKYGTSSKSVAEGDIPVIRMGNLQNGEIDWNNLVYSDNEEDIIKYKLEKYDVLFNRTNSAELVGKTSIYRGERPAIYAGYLIKLDYKKESVNGEYLNYYLNSPAAKEYCNGVKTDGVNQSNINAQKIGSFEISVPALLEQKEIVRLLDKFLSAEDKVKSTCQSTLETIATMRKSILAKAFRGELCS